MRFVICAAAPVFFALSACVGALQTTPDIVRTNALNEALQGATYSLPMLDYEVTVTRYLSSCPGDVANGKPTQLDFALDAKATGSYQRGESFRVDFSKLGGIARTGKFSIETHDNGTLKSIGASGEDQTGQIIQDLTKTALSAVAAVETGGASALAGTGFAEYASTSGNIKGFGAVVAPPEPRYQVVCKAETKAKLVGLGATAEAIKKRTDQVEDAKKLIETMSSRASLKLLTKGDREKLSRQFAILDQLDAQIRVLSKLLATQKKALGTVAKVAWKTDYSKRYNAQSLAVTIEEEHRVRLSLLLDRVPIGTLPGPAVDDQLPTACYGPGAAPSTCVEAMIETRMAFATDEPVMVKCEEGAPTCFSSPTKSDAVRHAYDGQSDPGIFVRDPVIARLLLCFKRSGVRCTPVNDQAGLEPQFTPQLGQLRFIPFKVRPFEGRSFALQMSKEGRVSKLEYSTDKAMLASASATAANVAAQVETALDKRETRRRGDDDYWHKRSSRDAQDQIDSLNRQIALKEATTKLADDPLGSVKNETLELQAQKALAEAKAARIEAEQKLERLLNPVP